MLGRQETSLEHKLLFLSMGFREETFVIHNILDATENLWYLKYTAESCMRTDLGSTEDVLSQWRDVLNGK